jgi:hypothetical protein
MLDGGKLTGNDERIDFTDYAERRQIAQVTPPTANRLQLRAGGTDIPVGAGTDSNVCSS